MWYFVLYLIFAVWVFTSTLAISGRGSELIQQDLPIIGVQ